MSEKILVRKIFDSTFSNANGMGITIPIDCFRTPFGVESFRLAVSLRFSLGIGDSVRMRAFGPALFANRIRLIGSRDAATDVFVNTSGMGLLWDNTTDYGLTMPEVVGPYGATQLFVGPGTFDVGFTVKIDMAPPRMETDWRRRVWYPGNAYSALTMEVDTRPLAGLFFGAIPASLTAISSNVQVTQTMQPTAWNLNKSDADLFFYQRILKDQLTITSAGEQQSLAPLGQLLERITAFAYDRDNVLPEDFLVSDVVVKEETSEMFHEPWQRFRSDNFDDFNLGNPVASYGRILVPFGRQGLAENLLDMRRWGAEGRTLTTAFTIPSNPGTPKGLDVQYNLFVGPYRVPARV